MRKEECRSCRYFILRSDSAGKAGGGYCRRFPPMAPAQYRVHRGASTGLTSFMEVSGEYLNDAWPYVQWQSWCGEYSQLKGEAR